MLDKIFISPEIHMLVGSLVVLTTLLSMLLAGWLAWKTRETPNWGRGTYILTQVVLMIQALIGIKLLDQGLGTLQLYIHYVGGLAPLFFFMLVYWFPARNLKRRNWAMVAAASMAFLFAFMSFGIGQLYVAGQA